MNHATRCDTGAIQGRYRGDTGAISTKEPYPMNAAYLDLLPLVQLSHQPWLVYMCIILPINHMSN